MGSTFALGFGVLLLIASIVAFFKVTNPRTGRIYPGNVFFPVAGVLVLVIIAAFTMFGTVDAKKYGVVTSFKKPTGEVLEAGAFDKYPWESVTEMDAAVQTQTYTFDVQMAGGAKATLNVYPSWEMKASAASDLFQQYKTFDNVKASLFEQQLVSIANNIFGSYNPLTNVDPKTGELVKTKEQWGTELKTALENSPLVKDKLTIHSVAIPIIQPDENTQNKLNEVIAEFARGSVLEQAKANTIKEKEIASEQVKIPDTLFCMRENSKNGLDAGTCLGGNSIIVDSRKK